MQTIEIKKMSLHAKSSPDGSEAAVCVLELQFLNWNPLNGVALSVERQ